MKTISKVFLVLFTAFALNSTLSAQSEQASISTTVPKARPVTETIAEANPGPEIVLTVKNACEKSVAVFAGPKEGIRDPKLSTYGGMSQNKVYVRANDVVCLMTEDKKPTACTIVKPGMTTVEVNSGGNTIAGR